MLAAVRFSLAPTDCSRARRRSNCNAMRSRAARAHRSDRRKSRNLRFLCGDDEAQRADDYLMSKNRREQRLFGSISEKHCATAAAGRQSGDGRATAERPASGAFTSPKPSCLWPPCLQTRRDARRPRAARRSLTQQLAPAFALLGAHAARVLLHRANKRVFHLLQASARILGSSPAYGRETRSVERPRQKNAPSAIKDFRAHNYKRISKRELDA